MRRIRELGPYLDAKGDIEAVPNEEELARELIGYAFAMDRFGGSLVVTPKRVRFPDSRNPDGPGVIETVGWVFKYESGNVPAVDAPKREPLAHELPEDAPPAVEPAVEPEATEPVPEPEPALAE